MAGRRNKRDMREALVARHQRRSAELQQELTKAAGHPGQQVYVAAQYLRGAIARTTRDVPAQAAAAGREAAALLEQLGDQLFRSAIEKRRSTR
jgi:hypothetical protein